MRKPTILLIALLSPAVQAQVRTWVDPGGLDTNDCSRAFPCRNFEAAIDAVADGGEVVVLQSGGFGPVTIDKSVSVVSPAGVHAAIAPTIGAAITIRNAAAAVINLRGLYLNSQGAIDGIVMDSGVVHIENFLISGFPGIGIRSANALLFVTDTTIRNGGWYGVHLLATVASTARTTLNRVRIHNHNVAVYAIEGTSVAIRDGVVSDVNTGYWVDGSVLLAEMSVENCVLTGSMDSVGYGIYAGGTTDVGPTEVSVSNSSVAYFYVGLYASSADLNAVARVSNSTFVHNGYGFYNATARIETRANNTVRNNGTPTVGAITNFPAR